MVMAATI
ncbi:hypothetical protein D030_3153A, partial [Vibrio parahaemolyticus AQ3810]